VPVGGPAPALRLSRLSLSQFRSYAALTWRPQAAIAVLHGPNGSGKTNLLEAISLLVPGRGLRGARVADLARHGETAWAVAGRFGTPSGEVDIGTGTPPDGPADRRTFRLDGAAPRSQAEIAARVSAVWLTPQMDRLFQDGASGRRRFLDRLVYALEPAHAREVAAYETATAGRNRLLAAGGADPAWLAGLEEQMARHAVAATAARAALVAHLNAALAVGAPPPSRPPASCCSTRSPSAWRASRRWRSRTGCARPWPPTGRATPRPAARRWAPTAPTWRCRTRRRVWRPPTPPPASRRRC